MKGDNPGSCKIASEHKINACLQLVRIVKIFPECLFRKGLSIVCSFITTRIPKDAGRLCFHRCLPVHKGGGGGYPASGPRFFPSLCQSLGPGPFWGYPMVSGPMSLPWSLILCPFRGGVTPVLSLILTGARTGRVPP